MRTLKLPKKLSRFLYVVLEGESDWIRLVIPKKAKEVDSYVEDSVVMFDYLLAQFDGDEEFVNHLLAGVANFRRVQLFPEKKWFIHIPENNYGTNLI